MQKEKNRERNIQELLKDNNNLSVGEGTEKWKFGFSEIELELNTIELITPKSQEILPGDIKNLYDFGNFILEFSKENSNQMVLTGIDVKTNDLLLFNEKLIGKELVEVLELGEMNNLSKPTIESISNEFCSNHILCFYDFENITFSFINYLCDSFHVGPKWKNENEYLFPA